MSKMASSMPKAMSRCREQITDEIINSVCAIGSKLNAVEAITKKHLNQSPVDLICSIIWGSLEARDYVAP